LIELLCVVAIIGILFSMLMPALAKAYRRVRAMSEEFDEGAVASMLVAEVRGYAAAHRVYQFDSKDDFANKVGLAPKCHDWINASHTEFVPFNNLDDTNKVVITFHYGRNYSQTEAFSKGRLTLPPADH
jgi:type II secretory pathway pseudopilin PulG